MRFLRWTWVFLCFFAFSSGKWQAQTLQTDLWIDPRAFHLDDPKIKEVMRKYPFKRIIISGFIGGQTIYPSVKTIFPQMPHYKGEKDIFGETIKELKKQGKKVYWAMDCLHWQDAKALREGFDIFEKHPGLVELDEGGDDSDPKYGKYASLFHPKVKDNLFKLAEETALRYPELEGILVQSGFGYADDEDYRWAQMGYSQVAKDVYKKEKGLDAEEVNLQAGVKDPEPAYLIAWVKWRGEIIADLVNEVCNRFQMGNPGAKRAALAKADFPRWSLFLQNISLEDPIVWAQRARLDEVVLETSGVRVGASAYNPKSSLAFETTRDLLANLPKPPKVTFLGYFGYYPSGERLPWHNLNSVRGRVVSRLLLRLEELPDYREEWKEWGPPGTLPELESLRVFFMLKDLHQILPRADLRQLELDPRLDSKTNPFEHPSLTEMLAIFSNTSGVPITASPLQPFSNVKLGWGASGQTVWYLMQRFALFPEIQGTWEKTEKGYNLKVHAPAPKALENEQPDETKEKEKIKPTTKPKEPEPGAGANFWLWAGGGVGLVLAAGLFFLWWKRRQKKMG